MWVLPSYGRPSDCAAVIAAMKAHGSIAPGIVYVCEDDPKVEEYLALGLPSGWWMLVMPAGQGWQPDKLQHAFNGNQTAEWYGWIADDIYPQTDGFEQALVGNAGAWGIASGNDLWQAREDVTKGRMHGATVFGGELLRAIGYWVPQGFRHWYIEDVWETLGRELGCWSTLMSVVTEHRHPFKAGKAGDETHSRANEAQAAAEGKARFAQWLSQEAPRTIFTTRAAMWASIGLSLEDIKGRSVMFGFPVASEVHPKREAAIMDTAYLLGQFGIRSAHVHIVGQTVHQARNGIVDAFLQSDFTDLFMIDADMSFSAWSVLKFLAAPHPLLAAVGRKRCEAEEHDIKSWCYHIDPSDRNGWVVDADKYGMYDVESVGTGFMRIRREVFEDLIAAYPEMKRKKDFVGEGYYYKFFAWTDDDGHEISEDLSFCRAYTKIGGKVWVDPSVALKHYGEKAFYGRLKNILY